MRSLLKCTLVGLFVVLSTSLKAGDKKTIVDTLSAESVLDRSAAAYGSLKTYLDSGKVITMFTNSSTAGKTAKIFRTAYASDGGFNFEYYDLGRSNSLYTVNRTNGVVKTWWGLMNKTDSPADLKMALGTLVGVSSKTSGIVPNLLLADDFKRNNIYYDLFAAAIVGHEVINKVECYKITASSKQYSKFTVWIGKKDLLARKMETESMIDPAKTQAFVHNIDSIVRARHLLKHDTAALKKDSIRQAKTAQTEALTNSMAAMKNMKPFTSIETYYFFPYTLKKPDPELFKFRPNREIAL